MPHDDADTLLDDQQDVDQDQQDQSADDTQDQQDADHTDGDADGDQGDAEKFFLTIDERTRYRTQEDAVTGFKKAGERIAQLSAWEKEVAKHYGITPKQAAELLNELALRRQGKWKDDSARRTDDSRSSDRDDATGKGDPYEGLTADEKKWAQWLEKRGWLRADAVKKMVEDGIKSVREEFQSQFSERDDLEQRSASAKESRAVLSSLLKESGLQNTPKQVKYVEGWIMSEFFADEYQQPTEEDPEGYFDGPKSAAYFAGGEERKRVLADAVKAFRTEVLDSMTAKADADYQKKKTDAMNKGGKPMPKGGKAGSKPDGEQDKTKLTLGDQRMQKAHDKAWKFFEKPDAE